MKGVLIVNFNFNPTFIDSICYIETDHWERSEYLPRKYNYEAILLLVKGEIEYEFQNGPIFTIKTGDLFFLPNNLPYKSKHTKPAAYYIIEFCTESNKQLQECFNAPKSIVPSNYELILSKFVKTLRVWNKSLKSSELYAKSLIFRLLCELFNDENDAHAKKTNEILDYIYDNLENQNLSVQHLCNVFHISASKLLRDIAKETTFTPKEYIMRLRLNKARIELMHTSKSIHQIAESCGFSNQFYFSRYFSAQYGVSPSEFRKNSN